jgi:hypothetical protein
MRYWKPEDICTVACPHCGSEIEFWKDEAFRQCSACHNGVRNPKLDLGCAAWCKHVSECLEGKPGGMDEAGAEKQPFLERKT